jgi:diguanylate cyclase (GGDEF)-like protein
MLTLPPTPAFETALRSAFVHLHRRLGLALWAAVRFEAHQPVSLLTRDHGYGVPDDVIARWAGTFANRWIIGHGPRIVTRLELLSDANELCVGSPLRLGACAGVPLLLDATTSFGAIFAFHPTPLPDAIVLELPALELVAQLLSTIWQSERRVDETFRLAERAQAEAHVDPLTRLRNRRAWDHLLETEEERCKRYEHPACVFVIDVDNLKQVNDTLGHAAGDELLRRTARALQTAARNPDVVARVGGDEFAVLAVESDLSAIPSLLGRFEEVLRSEGVQASIGFAM